MVVLVDVTSVVAFVLVDVVTAVVEPTKHWEYYPYIQSVSFLTNFIGPMLSRHHLGAGLEKQ